jgi:hypothetical protein
MQVSQDMRLGGGVEPWERVWRAVRGIYRGEYAETRARRWWSRRDRETARKALLLIETGAEARIAVIEEHAIRNPELRGLQNIVAGALDDETSRRLLVADMLREGDLREWL